MIIQKKIHLRAVGDMGKHNSWRTFCNMTYRIYNVTDDLNKISCKRCLNRIERLKCNKH